MLFDARQFEQFFEEKTLKKGLRLFEGGHLYLVSRPVNFNFIFSAGEAEIIVKKRGEKILNFECTCRKATYCEHFCASLFYFQQDALGISARKKNVSGKRVQAGPNNRLQEALRKIEFTALQGFVKSRNHIFGNADISLFFSDKRQVSVCDLYRVRMRNLLKPYLRKQSLVQHEIEALRESVNRLMAQVKKGEKQGTYFLRLAVLTEFVNVFNLRLTGDESKLRHIYEDAISELDKKFRSGLTFQEKDAWQSATVISVSSDKTMRWGAYFFLLPRALHFVRKEEVLAEFADQLNKRKYRSHYNEPLNRLLIAKMEVAIKRSARFRIPFAFKGQETVQELVIAHAELEMAAGKNTKAFERLEKGFVSIMENQKMLPDAYVEYIIEKARGEKKSALEKKYLQKKFVNCPFILPADLDRFVEICSPKSVNAQIDSLLSEVRTSGPVYPFEKVAAILLKGNRLEELLQEIKKQKNKFDLIHQAALRKFPMVNEALLNLYVQHLLEAFTSVKHFSTQQEVFRKARKFIDLLPQPTAEKILGQILDKLLPSMPIYNYIHTQFHSPLLKFSLN